MKKKPELLLPAGNLEKMRTAYDYGADAVYAGQPRYSLRTRNNEFLLEELGTGIREAHERQKKFFVASNIMPHNAKVRTYIRDMEAVIDMNPDGLIMADPGLIMMVREKWPDMPVHLSVQANTVNYASVKFWKSMGLKRVILSRELSLDEIAEIRNLCPDIELEVFVHGALCIAYSGRCLLSGYFNHRDPNQGNCTNSCRWSYRVHDASEDATGGPEKSKYPASEDRMGFENRHPLADRLYLLEESERPGDYMPIMEDDLGTYIMNSKDLRAVEYVEKLAEIGIDSLKIEGRTKSVYYVARTAQTYRQAIDDAAAGISFRPELAQSLEALSNRGYVSGFFERKRPNEMQNYDSGHSKNSGGRYVGDILGYNEDRGMAQIAVKNNFAVGDLIEIVHPSGNRLFSLERMEEETGAPLQEAPGDGWIVHITLPEKFETGMLAKITQPSGV